MSPPAWKQDVFLSFGEDVQTFISSLSERLHQVGIGHDKREGAGKNERAKRLDASRPSFAFALIVFSKDYINVRPVEELVEILECRKKRVMVIPIFYMERKKILHLARNGGLKKRHMTALEDAEKIRGYELKATNGERNLVDKIVGRLVKEIHSRYSGADFIFGPFGNKGQNDWTTVDIQGMNEIDVKYVESIESITFKVSDSIGTVPEHGKYDKYWTYKVILERGEYITSFAGFKNANDKDKIYSLTFRTNKRILGPIGGGKEEEKDYFSIPSDAGKVTKFFWREKVNFSSIGALVQLPSKNGPVKSEKPSGQEIGEPSDDGNQHTKLKKLGGGKVWDDGKFDGVKEIYLYVEDNIRYIVFEYDDGSENGHTCMHGDGTERSDTEDKVYLDYPREYLTSISCYTRKDGSIQSLTFYTNKKICSFGGPKVGEYFGYGSNGSKIIGFYGTWGVTLNSIGVYTEPILHLYPFGIVRPFTSVGGTKWDDGVYTGVREFRVSHIKNGHAKIESITFRYHNDGALVEGDRHGGKRDAGTWVKLDYPQEHLTAVGGYSHEEDGQTIIHDLIIYTTRTHYGPYAQRNKNIGSDFHFPKKPREGRIVGFFGTAGDQHLNFIGAHLEPY